jgi:hypothetical protein
MKKLLILLFFFIQINASKAQWREVYVPQSSSLFGLKGGIYFSKDSVAVYDLGQNFLSSDGGKTYTVWQERPLGDPFNIQSLGNGKIRCAGSSYSISASNTNGNSWFQIYVKNTTDTAFKSYRMLLAHYFDEQNAIAMGPINNGCYEVWTTKDGGNLWTRLGCEQIALPNYGNTLFLGFKALYNFNGTAIFKSSNQTNANKLIRVSNYGLNLDSLELPAGKLLVDMAFLNANEGLAILRDTGIDGTKSYYGVSNNGQTFTPYAIDLLYNPIGVITIKRTDSKTIYLLYGAEGLIYSNSLGTTWEYLDANRHLNLIGLDESHLTSFMIESGNTNRLRVFESELLGLLAQSKPLLQNILTNPVKDKLNLHAPDCAYQLINLNGQTVLSGKLGTSETTISISHLPIGLYVLNLSNQKGKAYTQKVIIAE